MMDASGQVLLGFGNVEAVVGYTVGTLAFPTGASKRGHEIAFFPVGFDMPVVPLEQVRDAVDQSFQHGRLLDISEWLG